MTLRNRILFAVMVSIWGSNWSVMKMGLAKAPPFSFISHRFLLTLVFLLAAYAVSKPRIPRDSKGLKAVLVYSLVSTLSFALTTLGLQSESSGVGAVLTYTQPIMVFMLAVTFLHEPFSALRLLGIILGFTGVAMLFVEDLTSTLSWAAVLLLLGAFLWAVSTIYYKLKLQDSNVTLVNLIHASVTASTIYSVSLLTEPPFQAWDLGYIAILAYAGIGASGIGMTIWLILLRDGEATSLSSACLVVPPIALLTGSLLMRESLTLRTLLGSTLIIVGIYLVNRKQKPRV